MLIGRSLSSVDKKNRLNIPAGFVGDLSKRVFVTQGLDRNLLLFPESSFENIFQQMRGLNLADSNARLLMRLMLGTACDVEIDTGNRISISEALREFAGLERDVVLIGQGNFIEIWDPELWRHQELKCQDVETDPDKFNRFDVSFGQKTTS